MLAMAATMTAASTAAAAIHRPSIDDDDPSLQAAIQLTTQLRKLKDTPADVSTCLEHIEQLHSNMQSVQRLRAALGQPPSPTEDDDDDDGSDRLDRLLASSTHCIRAVAALVEDSRRDGEVETERRSRRFTVSRRVVKTTTPRWVISDPTAFWTWTARLRLEQAALTVEVIALERRVLESRSRADSLVLPPSIDAKLGAVSKSKRMGRGLRSRSSSSIPNARSLLHLDNSTVPIAPHINTSNITPISTANIAISPSETESVLDPEERFYQLLKQREKDRRSLPASIYELPPADPRRPRDWISYVELDSQPVRDATILFQHGIFEMPAREIHSNIVSVTEAKADKSTTTKPSQTTMAIPTVNIIPPTPVIAAAATNIFPTISPQQQRRQSQKPEQHKPAEQQPPQKEPARQDQQPNQPKSSPGITKPTVVADINEPHLSPPRKQPRVKHAKSHESVLKLQPLPSLSLPSLHLYQKPLPAPPSRPPPPPPPQELDDQSSDEDPEAAFYRDMRRREEDRRGSLRRAD